MTTATRKGQGVISGMDEFHSAFLGATRQLRE